PQIQGLGGESTGLILSALLAGNRPLTWQDSNAETAYKELITHNVVRPGDAAEVSWAWKTILERRYGPAGIALTRQDIAVFERGDGDASGEAFASARKVALGAYVLAEAPNGRPDVILIATGSEVQLAVAARAQLAIAGINARVVSAPCLEWFEEQSPEYRESVLPASVTARVSVEAGIALGWRGYVGDRGRSISIEHFGASADGQTLFREFGITAEAVVAAAQESIAAPLAVPITVHQFRISNSLRRTP
ncbi:transketolase C-terminal domain-containing protein, partial [Cryobacterium sp. PH31-AA6]|uniref:transketolase-like TK C-terminal-containing protein n=1 Tax=Cryobacterium sp. PH31-AA6 TaxID=3046205 RepID=UPI0024B92469